MLIVFQAKEDFYSRDWPEKLLHRRDFFIIQNYSKTFSQIRQIYSVHMIGSVKCLFLPELLGAGLLNIFE